MSTYQRAVINGLIAENIGKNDLVRNSELMALDAQHRANDERRKADGLKADIIHLKGQNEILQKKVEDYEKLLSRPMKDIAAINGDFRKTYEMQQEILANWILSQQAYRETSKIYAEKLGVDKSEFSKQYNQSVNDVLTNNTKHDNNGSEFEPLASSVSQIIAMRKKDGKM